GESITEVQIGEWQKKVGDQVRRDEIIVMIETDKVTVELPAPFDGTITKILVGDGDDANVGDSIGYMEEGAVDAPSATASAKKESEKQAPPAEAPAPAPQPDTGPSSVRDSLPPEAFARVMPSARRVAADSDIDVNQVPPTGPGGRVLKEDVQRAAARPQAASASAPRALAPAAPHTADPRGEEVVKMTPMRRKIAE